jgi:hypothetical protein
MLKGAEVDADIDDDGVGRAWAVPGMAFADARKALPWTPGETVGRGSVTEPIGASKGRNSSQIRPQQPNCFGLH